MSSSPVNVICAKWGSCYGPEYVNNLYAMVKRNLTLPFRFACITENEKGIHKDIEVYPLPDKNLTGWWTKIAFFQSPLFDLTGLTLSIDLDMLIVDNIDPMFSFQPNQFCMKWDYASHGHSSCVMRFEAGKHAHVYNNLNLKRIDHAEHNTKRGFKKHKYWGDQIWITEQMKGKVTLWPKLWIQKYIRDCHRNVQTKKKFGEKGRARDFNDKVFELFVPNQCKIMAFSGTRWRHETERHKIRQWWNANDLSGEYR